MLINCSYTGTTYHTACFIRAPLSKNFIFGPKYANFIKQLNTLPDPPRLAFARRREAGRLMVGLNMYTIYILKSLNFPKTYVGITNNMQRRLLEHNGSKSTFTKRYAPWKVVYTEESKDLSGARKREKYFKSSVGRKRILEIIK